MPLPLVNPNGWQPTIVRRFIKGLGTGTEAAVVETDVGRGYLKAMGNAGGEHCLACELVATQLARWFGLSTFDHALIRVEDPGLIPLFGGGFARVGWAFITRAESGETWGGNARQLGRLANPEDVGRLIVFDTWIRNCDRCGPGPRLNYGNVFLSEEAAPEGQLILKAMDHTHAFACGRDLTPRIAHIDRIRDPEAYGCFPGFLRKVRRHPDSFRDAIRELGGIDGELVRRIVASIPREWDVCPRTGDALVALICERARFLSSNRTGIMGILLQQGQLNLSADREDAS